eukprot:scaffold15634_cov33-Prasinocladus_malaysianus.AAC.2
MKIKIELEVSPDEVPLATELVATLRNLTSHVSVKQVRFCHDMLGLPFCHNAFGRKILIAINNGTRGLQTMPGSVAPGMFQIKDPSVPIQPGPKVDINDIILCWHADGCSMFSKYYSIDKAIDINQ